MTTEVIDVITPFARQSAWVTPSGQVLCKNGVFAHSALLRGIESEYHDGAFRNGLARVCMDAEGILSVQWGGKLTSAQRSVFEEVMQTATYMLVSSMVDGYDPEDMAMRNATSRWEHIEKRKIPASFVRKIRQALRMDMGSYAAIGLEPPS